MQKYRRFGQIPKEFYLRHPVFTRAQCRIVPRFRICAAQMRARIGYSTDRSRTGLVTFSPRNDGGFAAILSEISCYFRCFLRALVPHFRASL
jgi:hypothetical protein